MRNERQIRIEDQPPSSVPSARVGFAPRLNLYDSVMIVAGSMIGSAIFIVTSEMSRQLGSAGWLMISWLIAGLLTVTGALSYGELASMMPKAGGQYVYLREAFSPIVGFLYGWTLFLVIQTGTVAAVAVGFARYLGVFIPQLSESNYLIAPIHIFPRYAISLSTTQAVAILVLVLLTWTNTRGLEYGKLVQNTFTISKLVALAGLVVAGLFIGRNAAAWHTNFASLWKPHGYEPITSHLSAATGFGIFIALCVSETGSLFAADAWNNITFVAGEIKNPRRNVPLSLAVGTISVIGLYMLVNLAYLSVLPLSQIQHAPSDRVAAAMLQAVFPSFGRQLIAVLIMISTFGCINGMLLAGARTYYAMARDGLFFRKAQRLSRARVPAVALVAQGFWATFLVLPRTYDPSTKVYGNLYSSLLDYVISAALLFYILTIAGIFRLRKLRPLADRPYRAFGYPVIPILYLVGTGTLLVVLLLYRPATTIPGFLIIAFGIPVYFLLRRTNLRIGDEQPSSNNSDRNPDETS
jgi:APA family basic amino acid/polyamine antiporter